MRRERRCASWQPGQRVAGSAQKVERNPELVDDWVIQPLQNLGCSSVSRLSFRRSRPCVVSGVEQRHHICKASLELVVSPSRQPFSTCPEPDMLAVDSRGFEGQCVFGRALKSLSECERRDVLELRHG